MLRATNSFARVVLLAGGVAGAAVAAPATAAAPIPLVNGEWLVEGHFAASRGFVDTAVGDSWSRKWTLRHSCRAGRCTTLLRAYNQYGSGYSSIRLRRSGGRFVGTDHQKGKCADGSFAGSSVYAISFRITGARTVRGRKYGSGIRGSVTETSTAGCGFSQGAYYRVTFHGNPVE
jgi:hypothetical protein